MKSSVYFPLVPSGELTVWPIVRSKHHKVVSSLKSLVVGKEANLINIRCIKKLQTIRLIPPRWEAVREV